MKNLQIVEIQDLEHGDIYTAHIQRNGAGWVGWIVEHPHVKCEKQTKKALLETLEKTLHEVLEVDWEAWDKQLEEDVKAGRLDGFAEKALANFRDGKYYEIEKLQELLEA